MIEFFRDMRRTGFLVGLRILVLTLTALLVFHSCSFFNAAERAVRQSFSQHAEASLFSLYDSLRDPDSFAKFGGTPGEISAVEQFYDELNTSDALTFLSVFDQFVPMTQFRGGEQFEYSTAHGMPAQGMYADPITGVLTRNVHSYQMNHHAFEFFGITLQSGTEPDWDSIDYQTETVPVLLGSEYTDLYALGDELTGYLYFMPMHFQVVGFLAPASSVYYQGNHNTFLDTSVVIPYPPSLGHFSLDDAALRKVLAFAMVNGTIAVPTELTKEQLLAQLDTIAQGTGFSDYTLNGMPSYLIELRLMRSLITDNTALMVSLLVVTGILASIIVTALGIGIAHRRTPLNRILRTLGHSSVHLHRRRGRLGAIECGVTLLFFILIVAHAPNPSPAGSAVGIASIAGILTVSRFIRTVQARTQGESSLHVTRPPTNAAARDTPQEHSRT